MAGQRSIEDQHLMQLHYCSVRDFSHRRPRSSEWWGIPVSNNNLGQSSSCTVVYAKPLKPIQTTQAVQKRIADYGYESQKECQPNSADARPNSAENAGGINYGLSENECVALSHKKVFILSKITIS